MAAASLLSRFTLVPPLAHPFKRALSTQSKLILALERPWRVKSVPASFSLLRSIDTDAGMEAISVPKSVPVLVAHELLQAGHRYLDVRTVDEFNAGHVVGAMNIPYMFKAGSGGCQSGRRSLMAITDLSSAGFTAVVDIAGGHSAWVETGLPTEQ
ncbi:putative thiosulfate sulfurtransferase [Dioscorea sansibarensis]